MQKGLLHFPNICYIFRTLEPECQNLVLGRPGTSVAPALSVRIRAPAPEPRPRTSERASLENCWRDCLGGSTSPLGAQSCGAAVKHAGFWSPKPWFKSKQDYQGPVAQPVRRTSLLSWNRWVRIPPDPPQGPWSNRQDACLRSEKCGCKSCRALHSGRVIQ